MPGGVKLAQTGSGSEDRHANTDAACVLGAARAPPGFANTMTATVHDVVIVGGGLTGAATAIHLVREAKTPLRIAIVEPDAHLGRGLAYGNPEADHRLNGPGCRHTIYPEDLSHFHDWYMAQALNKHDPEARDLSGYHFPRRYDFGTYLNTQIREHIASNPSGSTINHVIDHATDIVKKEPLYQIALEGGDTIAAKVLVVAATPGRANIPPVLASLPSDGPTFLPDPWDTDRLRRIPKSAEVLILGMAQTASDVAASLLKYDHSGPITLLSRRGKRPRKRPPLDASSYLRDAVPEVEKHAQFMEPDLTVMPASKVLQALRREAHERASRGESWVPVMEKLSELICDHWHTLPLETKKRFLRHGRTWYDVHRFRLPPQIESRMDAAEARGQLKFTSASILDAKLFGKRLGVTLRKRGTQDITTKTYDVTINCTGLEDRPDHTANPFLRALIARGFAARHPSGSGFNVDIRGNAIDPNGHTNQSLFIVGPLTYGAFADQQGSIFIVRRIMRVVPDILLNATAA